jgi:predicted helicase
MHILNLKPTHKVITTYYTELDRLATQTKMKLSQDKTSLVYNDFLTFTNIPPEAFEYNKLGNKSALHWILDQYQVTTNKRSGIVNDPNRADKPDYIIKLIKKVVTVSVETVKIIKDLPELNILHEPSEP